MRALRVNGTKITTKNPKMLLIETILELKVTMKQIMTKNL